MYFSTDFDCYGLLLLLLFLTCQKSTFNLNQEMHVIKTLLNFKEIVLPVSY